MGLSGGISFNRINMVFCNVSTSSGLDIEHANRLLSSLKGTKREKLHAMHVKELIKTNYSEW